VHYTWHTHTHTLITKDNSCKHDIDDAKDEPSVTDIYPYSKIPNRCGAGRWTPHSPSASARLGRRTPTPLPFSPRPLPCLCFQTCWSRVCTDLRAAGGLWESQQRWCWHSFVRNRDSAVLSTRMVVRTLPPLWTSVRRWTSSAEIFRGLIFCGTQLHLFMVFDSEETRPLGMRFWPAPGPSHAGSRTQEADSDLLAGSGRLPRVPLSACASDSDPEAVGNNIF